MENRRALATAGRSAASPVGLEQAPDFAEVCHVATEITVGPPVLTINHGSTFMVTDRQGEIHPDQELGVFAQDTRFVGYYRCTIERQPWVLLTSSTTSYCEMRLVYTNPALPALDDPLANWPEPRSRSG
jgi:hypothetical protein